MRATRLTRPLIYFHARLPRHPSLSHHHWAVCAIRAGNRLGFLPPQFAIRVANQLHIDKMRVTAASAQIRGWESGRTWGESYQIHPINGGI